MSRRVLDCFADDAYREEEANRAERENAQVAQASEITDRPAPTPSWNSDGSQQRGDRRPGFAHRGNRATLDWDISTAATFERVNEL